MVVVIKKGMSKKDLAKLLAKAKKPRVKDLTDLAGTVKLSIDPLIWQKKIRDEWG